VCEGCFCECPQGASEAQCAPGDPCEDVDAPVCCAGGEEFAGACRADGDSCSCECPQDSGEGPCVGPGVCDNVAPGACCMDGVAAVQECGEAEGLCVCLCPEGAAEGACENPCALVDPGPCCLDGVQSFADCQAEAGECACACPEGATAEFCPEPDPCALVDPMPCCQNGQEVGPNCQGVDGECVCECPAGAEPGFCEPACGNPDANPECNFDMERAACEAAGGNFGQHGLNPQENCLCRSADAGCACAGSTCQGTCFAPLDDGCEGVVEGQCSEFVTAFGCICVPVGEGQWAGLCID
jgi:hypothetical protein